MLVCIFDVLRIYEHLQIFFYKLLLKSGKMKIFSPPHSLKLKNTTFFLIKAWIFFQMVIFPTLFWRYPTLWKPALKMTTLFWRCLKLFNSTLLKVVNFNVDIHNVVSTLIWRCATSRRHINLKTTMNRRWNVCWVKFRKIWL